MRAAAHRACCCVAAALVMTHLTPGAAVAQTFEVAITDPQDRPVPGALAVVTCDDRALELRADREGRVTLSSASDLSACVLTISHAGFATVHEPLGSRRPPMRIRLSIAPVRERVEVSGAARAPNPLSGAASTVLEASDLEGIGNTIEDWLQYARAVAGARAGHAQMTVDGLPSDVLPPRGAVARIAVNQDPFSAEHAAPDAARIEIVTRAPDPAFRWSLGGSALGFGGRNPLAPQSRPASHALSFETSGAPGGMGFMARGFVSRAGQPIAVRTAAVPGQPHPAEVAIPRQRGAGITTMLFHGAEDATQWRATYYHGTSRIAGAGVGELTTPEAGTDSRFDRRDLRMTLRGAHGRLRYRGGLAFSASDSRTAADTPRAAIRVIGSLIAGPPALSRDADHRRLATIKAAIGIDDVRHPFEVGGSITSTTIRIDRTPNPQGTLLFPTIEDYARALNGAATATRIVQMGDGRIRTINLEMDAFAQVYVLQRRGGFVRAGLRIDTQTGDAMRWSPRAYAATARGRLVMTGGAGVFTQNWPADLFSSTAMRDASHLRELLVNGVALDDAMQMETDSVLPRLLVSSIAGDFRRRRDVIARASILRPARRFAPKLEYTVVRGRYLAGSRRLATDVGWVDEIASRARLVRHQLHASLSFTTGRMSVSSHYEWVRSSDSSAGALAIESAGTDTWARSAGVPPWRATLVTAMKLPASLSLSIVASADGAAPYDITTSRDVAGDYLFTDRGGRGRNSGRTPGARRVDLYAHRRVRIPRSVPLFGTLGHLNVGAQVENVFGWQHYFSYGSVMGSPLFGEPLAARAGRSVRLWVTL